jgi:hypothetical protein
VASGVRTSWQASETRRAKEVSFFIRIPWLTVPT